MIPNGYFLIARSLFQSELATAPLFIRWMWLWLLGKASWSDGKNLKRGQVLTTLQDLADACSYHVGYRKVHTIRRKGIWRGCEWLRERDMIKTTKATRGIIITICNYEKYQNPGNYENDNEGTTNGTMNGTMKRTMNGTPPTLSPMAACSCKTLRIKNKERKKEKKTTTTTSTAKNAAEAGDERVIPASPSSQRRKDAHAEAFKVAFDSTFGQPYAWQAADFVHLARFRKTYPAVDPATFADKAQELWAQGIYCPKLALSIRGLTSNWAVLLAGLENRTRTPPPGKRSTFTAAKSETNYNELSQKF